MSRRDAILLWAGMWGCIGYFGLLLMWPLIFAPLLLVILFFVTLYAAIFVWPGEEP